MNYELTIHEGSIISCQGEPVDITIPAEVVRIAESAFKDKNTLKSVKFEGTAIKAIEAEAFCGCNSLLGVVLPVGTVHIGARAFKDCKELRYVSIPSTVMVIDEDAFSGTRRDFVILGVEGKESEKYAKEHKHIFKPSTKTLLMQLKAAEKERAKVETRVFEVLGQKITCSNTLGMYHEALVYYADRKDDFYEKYIGKLPMSYGSQVKVDLLPIIETEWNATVKRLETHGVSATENTLSLNSTKYLTAFSTLCDISKKIADAFVTVRNEVYEAVSSNNSQLIQEAENSITGLSYGIIGDGLDMLAYSLDNYSAKKRQRKEAYAEAQKKADAFGLKASSAAEKAYAEFIKNALPKLRACTDNYIDALCDAEIQTLIYAGLIEGGIEKDLDIQKSSELVASLSGASGDDTYTIGLALKKYPHNIAAHVYAAEHNYKDAGLDALTAFLGLDATIKKILQQKEQQRYDDCLNHLKHVATENAATLVGALQHNQIPLRDADLTAVLKLVSQNIQLKLNEKIENAPVLKKERISEYCHDALVSIISAGDCGYLIDKGMILPKDYSSYADIEPYLIQKVTEKIDVLEQERIAEEKRLQIEAEQRAEEARKQAKAKHESKVGLTIILSILCATIVFFVVLTKIIIPNSKYNNMYNDAISLVEAGSYTEAIAMFEVLGDYKDSFTLYENAFQVLTTEYAKRAEQALASGDNIQAAIMYRKAGDSITANKSFNISSRVYAGEFIAAGIMSDGSLKYQSNHEYEWDEADKDLSGIVGFLHSGGAIAGINSKGQLLTHNTGLFGNVNIHDDMKIGSYNNITSIVHGVADVGKDNAYYVAMLFSDGTVGVAYQGRTNPYPDLKKWENIVSIQEAHDAIIGIDRVGNVLMAKEVGGSPYGYDPSSLADIKQVIAPMYSDHLVALKQDGTIEVLGSNQYLASALKEKEHVSQICPCDDGILLLYDNGTVEWVIEPSDSEEYTEQIEGYREQIKSTLSNWKGIVSLEAGASGIIGIKIDGKVNYVSTDIYYDDGEYSEPTYRYAPHSTIGVELSAWEDIVHISSASLASSSSRDISNDWAFAIGIKSDGTAVSTGNGTYYTSEANVYEAGYHDKKHTGGTYHDVSSWQLW